MLFDNDMNTVLDVFIEKYGYLPTRNGYVPANAGARKVYFRLMRRARRARKNLVMYKLAGRRPWDCGPFVEVLDSLTRQLGDGQRLRESSGFIDMSKAAEVMR